MKKLIFTLLLFAAVQTTFAQSQSSSTTPVSFKFPPLDKSPLDVAYFPANYPILKTQGKISEPLMARVIYSRPQKENREIFGELVEYNKVWRLGANEATEIETFQDVKIKGKKLPKGRYTIYAIPTTNQWTIIFNKETDIWGAFKYDEKKDVLRADIPVQKNPSALEAFTISFTKTTTGADLIIAWDDVLASLPISIQ